MGPVLLFDKSTLQSLNLDEAVWLDQFFVANITPLFFVETLADLEKTTEGDRTPEQIVADLASKTPTYGLPNVHHDTLCFYELLGKPVEMEGRVIPWNGKQFSEAGQRGIVMEQPPEVEAFNRWRDGKFLSIEHEFAQAWRKALSALDLDAVAHQGRAIIERLGRPRGLAEAKGIAVALLKKRGSRDTREALRTFPWPEDARRKVIKRWCDLGAPPLGTVAPYTAHVLTVDLFFSIALGAGLIGHDRPSNKIDIAYLYYLPFCDVFTSSDNLHKRTAPLFKTERQEFVWGQDLKGDLGRLDAYYDTFPADVKERGVIAFASYPPTDGNFLVSRLWDKFIPGWRVSARRPAEPMSPEAEKQLTAQLNRMSRATELPGGQALFSPEEADAILIKYQVPIRRGKWRLLPREVETEGA